MSLNIDLFYRKKSSMRLGLVDTVCITIAYMDKIVGQTEFFSFGKVNSQKGLVQIQTSSVKTLTLCHILIVAERLGKYEQLHNLAFHPKLQIEKKCIENEHSLRIRLDKCLVV